MHSSSPRRRLLLYLAVPLALVACAGGDSPLAPPVPPAHDPIIFVHGFNGSPEDFAPVIARFKADGWTDPELVAAQYSNLSSNASIADDIRQRVDAVLASTGAAKVDIIAFSMGSVSSRYYLKNLGGTTKADAWVSVAGPNHGTETANSCSFTPCVEIRVGSAFLATLNANDETPGSVRYATWWSPCDQTIIPNSSVPLAGATNTQTECLAHSQMFTETNYQQVKSFIAP